jgi:hypothetical protein
MMSKQTKIPLLAITLWLAAGNLFAQHQELGEKPSIWQGKEKSDSASNSLRNAFIKGTMHGHLRYFFMETNNTGELSDYYANAAGGGIKFETAPIKGFQLGISGFFTFNLASSPLGDPDPKTGAANRYEIGLFDQQDPYNTSDIDRLEELFLKYSFKKNHITIGKQLINTPFINLQDGRMRPTEVNAIWSELHSGKTKWEGGLIKQISPRGTVRWFNVGESIGIYPMGVNPDGGRSAYRGNTESKGLVMAGITNKSLKYLTLQAWHMYVHNIFNTTMLQADIKHPLGDKGQLLLGMQWIEQFRSGDGGNVLQELRYVQDKQSGSFGAMAGWEKNQFKTTLAFNRISDKGRFLMPREWGRDPFYTFMARERNEGLANANALVSTFSYKFPKTGIKTNLSMGYFDLPDAADFARNKYGLPSYTQLNLDIRYDFKGWLQGLNTQLLIYHKWKTEDGELAGKYLINKVNMQGWNIVFNYNF